MQKKKVLVIDDDEIVLELVFDIFEEKKKFVVSLLHNPKISQIENIDPFAYDIVLCDFNMTNVNGLDLLKYLINKSNFPRYVLISSAKELIEGDPLLEGLEVYSKFDICSLINEL